MSEKQVIITMQDITDNRYTFDKDVITRHKTGVSKTGSEEAQSNTPASKFNANYHYVGASLQQVMGHADYDLGVKLRASLRGNNKKPAWMPPANTDVDVYVTKGGKIDVSSLPVEAQIAYYFDGIEDLAVRKKAKAAFLAAL